MMWRKLTEAAANMTRTWPALLQGLPVRPALDGAGIKLQLPHGQKRGLRIPHHHPYLALRRNHILLFRRETIRPSRKGDELAAHRALQFRRFQGNDFPALMIPISSA